MDINSNTVLNNGVKMPWIGYGTYKAEKDLCISGVKAALEVGYRHIDTASFYGNEGAVAIGIEKSGVKREDIFLVSKVWNADQGYNNTIKSFEETLKKLGTEYLDLFLIHWPMKSSRDTWRAMEKLYSENKIRAIGVSNFNINHLCFLMETADIKPAVNQVEFHPELIQQDLIDFCRDKDIQMEAWSPLIRGKVFEIPLLHELSKKYGKTISQIVLRWDIQKGFVTIPKSTNLQRLKENINIFDFEISNEDMFRIDNLNSGNRIGMNPEDIFNGIKIKS